MSLLSNNGRTKYPTQGYGEGIVTLRKSPYEKLYERFNHLKYRDRNFIGEITNDGFSESILTGIVSGSDADSQRLGDKIVVRRIELTAQCVCAELGQLPTTRFLLVLDRSPYINNNLLWSDVMSQTFTGVTLINTPNAWQRLDSVTRFKILWDSGPINTPGGFHQLTTFGGWQSHGHDTVQLQSEYKIDTNSVPVTTSTGTISSTNNSIFVSPSSAATWDTAGAGTPAEIPWTFTAASVITSAPDYNGTMTVPTATTTSTTTFGTGQFLGTTIGEYSFGGTTATHLTSLTTSNAPLTAESKKEYWCGFNCGIPVQYLNGDPLNPDARTKNDILIFACSDTNESGFNPGLVVRTRVIYTDNTPK